MLVTFISSVCTPSPRLLLVAVAASPALAGVVGAAPAPSSAALALVLSAVKPLSLTSAAGRFLWCGLRIRVRMGTCLRGLVNATADCRAAFPSPTSAFGSDSVKEEALEIGFRFRCALEVGSALATGGAWTFATRGGLALPPAFVLFVAMLLSLALASFCSFNAALQSARLDLAGVRMPLPFGRMLRVLARLLVSRGENMVARGAPAAQAALSCGFCSGGRGSLLWL